MTLIEDYSSEALIEILSLLEDRVRRCGECQISSTSIRRVLQKRFGLPGASSTMLYNYVEGYLVGAGILKVWAINTRIKTRLAIFEIDPDKLRYCYLDSLIDSE